jgi:hypothetical protein
MKFYANPYNGDVTGFYFETYDEFEEGVEELEKEYKFPVEEFSIEIIDGNREEIELLQTIGVDQGNLQDVLDVIENMDESDWPKLFFLLDNNVSISLKDAINKVDDVYLHRGSLFDAAYDYFNEMYEVPSSIRNYIDYEKVAEEFDHDGAMVEFEFGGDTYTCVNVNDL